MAEQANFERHIRQNVYPGRGLVIGRAAGADGWLIVYWIMGRSPNSQNRRFVAEGGTLRTEPVDLAKVEDPRLIIYTAMLDLPPDVFLVSNGDQTNTVYAALQAGRSFDEALATREREPDAPNYTPRITGMLERANSAVTLSLLKANAADPALTDRITYRPAPPPPGLGYGLTTYTGDGNPLPSFAGDPVLLPLGADAASTADQYWTALNADNRVALAAKFVPAAGNATTVVIRNRFGD